MVFITAGAYKNAHVHTITVKNKDYFWVKMKHVGDGLGVKNMKDLVSKDCVVFLKLKILLKSKKENIKEQPVK